MITSGEDHVTSGSDPLLEIQRASTLMCMRASTTSNYKFEYIYCTDRTWPEDISQNDEYFTSEPKEYIFQVLKLEILTNGSAGFKPFLLIHEIFMPVFNLKECPHNKSRLQKLE